jgi:hypothetical protein
MADDFTVDPVPDHVNLKLDPELRKGIEDFQRRMRLKNRSDGIRTLLVLGLRQASQPEGSPELALAQAAYKNAFMRAIAAVKSGLPELLNGALEKLLSTQDTR